MPDVGPQLPPKTSVVPPVAPAVTTKASAPLAEVEPAVGKPPLPSPPPEELAPSAASPPTTNYAPPVHGDVTIRGWFNDVFANLIATGRIRADKAEEHLQDLLKRLGY